LVYKGRPLNGIWATAPYLHNGSVRTLRQLLLPATQRQKTFNVGSREYDPNDAGFKDVGNFKFDASLPGNSNAGHEYGAQDLADHPDKLNALMEYLKSL
jgi:cytochrome c peroxidase